MAAGAMARGRLKIRCFLFLQECFLTMTVSWYQSLIKVLLSRFPQSCRHFHNAETGTQYLVRHSPLPTCTLCPCVPVLDSVLAPF